MLPKNVEAYHEENQTDVYYSVIPAVSDKITYTGNWTKCIAGEFKEFDDDSNDIGKDLGILNADDCNIKENFCVRNGIITPFLEVPFANDTISRVYISPMTEFEIAKLSIRELIDQKGYKQTRIYQSNIPIRY